MLKSKEIFLDNTISGLEDVLITGASEKGTWARLFHPPVEGKLIRGFEGLDVGDRVGLLPKGQNILHLSSPTRPQRQGLVQDAE